LDKTATADESFQKPGGMLIVILGTILSGMLAIFIALVLSALKKRGMKLQHLT
jgi:LPS O-antigen subunit length determinant protein (WzzB/FepE family)